MKKFIFLMIVPILLFFTVTSSPMDSSGRTPTDRLVFQIGWYESRNNHNVKPGDNGESFGRWQFQIRTFDWMKELSGMSDLDISSEKDQEKLLRWALKNGYGNHWAGYRIVKNKIHAKHKHVKADTKAWKMFVPGDAEPFTIKPLTINI